LSLVRSPNCVPARASSRSSRSVRMAAHHGEGV